MKQQQQGNVAVAVLYTIVGLILLAAIVVGGYQLGWWLKQNAVNRNAKINRTSYEVQQTYREEVLKDMQQVSTDDSEIANPAYSASVEELRAQRVHDVQVACDHISRLTTSGAGVDPDIQAFQDKECTYA